MVPSSTGVQKSKKNRIKNNDRYAHLKLALMKFCEQIDKCARDDDDVTTIVDKIQLNYTEVTEKTENLCGALLLSSYLDEQSRDKVE